jgi:hypothetical protein
VVDGIRYSLTLLVGLSQCKNDGQCTTLQQCPVDVNTVERWHAEVWVHPTQPPQYDVLALSKVKV